MAFNPRPKSEPIGFNLTPMIDVTFQLLIFFVCTNTWSHIESAEELSLPSPIVTGRAPGEAQRRFTISLRTTGETVVRGRVVTPQRLAEMLRSEHRKVGEQLEVMLRAHRDVPYAHTQEVFQACTQAGIRKVRFAVLRDG